MPNSIDNLCSKANYSWIEQLTPDPETEKYAPNHKSREVRSGHYVEVKPTPLPDPHLIIVSPQLLEELGLTKEDCENDERFVRFFSGDWKALEKEGLSKSWATPYALAIYGTDYLDNCPFRTGNGYGDGRAISNAEVLLDNGKRWEFQLKGSGKTPFCRGADGRAVLRSSVREFLVSEAMHHFGISTTRALSLIVSGTEKVSRPWYSGKQQDIDEDVLQNVPQQYRRLILERLLSQTQQPDVLVENPAAIATRVAPSFIRVGHIQLFERRARSQPSRTPELQQLVQHALFREFPEILNDDSKDFNQKVLSMLRECSERITTLTAEWVRVGFCQGNFNSDNCLIAGRTMDYGPFGFLEKFTPYWNMWSGGGEHFGFINQPVAGHKNFNSLARAVEPLFDKQGVEEVRAIATENNRLCRFKLQQVWSKKLGFAKYAESQTSLINDCIELLEETTADYTIFWRQLAHLPAKYLASNDSMELTDSEILGEFSNCFYDTPSSKTSTKFVAWVRQWLKDLKESSNDRSGEQITNELKLISPKYVPREWMLVDAYTNAMKGDYTAVYELFNLFLKPYDEQSEFEEKFYKKAPNSIYQGGGCGGTAFMSCSS